MYDKNETEGNAIKILEKWNNSVAYVFYIQFMYIHTFSRGVKRWSKISQTVKSFV